MGTGLYCLFASKAKSRATINPIREIAKAVTFRCMGIVITGVFSGETTRVIKRPAIMLPQASRLIGLMTRGLFSLIGESGLNRGEPNDTK